MFTKSNRLNGALRASSLKDLVSQTNFEDLLQLRSLVMYVVSFSGFLRSAEILELRRSDIIYKSDDIEINIVKSKTDHLRDGKTLVIAETGGDLCPVKLLQLYLSKVEIPDNSKEYIFWAISSSRSRRSLFLPTGTFRTLLTENLSKRHLRVLFLTFETI